MSLNAFLSLDKLRKSIRRAPAINVDSGRRPGVIFPHFTWLAAAGPINSSEWAEGNWVYILGLSGPFSASFDQLFSYAVASDVLDEAGVKVLGVSTMNHGLLQKLSADVSAIAGQTLSTKLVCDQESKLSKRFGLKEFMAAIAGPTKEIVA